MHTGCEWIIDASDCLAERLQNGEVLRATAAAIISDLQLHVVGEPHWHQFPAPGGWTGLYLLSESHLTVHTFPERGIASWNLYCCRPRPDWNWSEQLAARLGARRVEIRRCPRPQVTSTPPFQPTTSAARENSAAPGNCSEVRR